MPLFLSILVSALALPVALAISASLLIWFYSLALKCRNIGGHAVDKAEQLVAARKARSGAQNPQEPPPDKATEAVRVAPPPRWINTRSWLSKAAVLAIAVAVSAWIGTQVLYVPMVSTAYQTLYRSYCQADGIAEILSHSAAARHFSAKTTGEGCGKRVTADPTAKLNSLSHQEVFVLLDGLGILDPKEKNVATLFAGPTPPTRKGDASSTPHHDLAVWLGEGGVYAPGRTSTSELLVRLASKIESQHTTGPVCQPQLRDEPENLSLLTASMAATMAQQPREGGEPVGRQLLGSGQIQPLTVLVTDKPADICDGDGALALVGLGNHYRASWGPYKPLITRSDDRLTDAEIVDVALAWTSWTAGAETATPQQAATIEFMREIGSAAGATSKVRSARIAVNFFIGWERLAILVVATFLSLCLLWQQLMNVVAASHLHWIRDTIQKAQRRGIDAVAPLSILQAGLYRKYGRSAPREILVAALEVAQQRSEGQPVDFDRIRRVGEQELRISDRRRFFFLAGLPLLPTIGFIGTVHSLIEALSIADQIPRARDPVDQIAAVADVTSTLSLCFSTTFLALTALLIFAPLDLWQAANERRTVEETERLLDREV